MTEQEDERRPGGSMTYDPKAVAALDWLRAFVEQHCNLDCGPLQEWAAAGYPGATTMEGAVVVGTEDGGVRVVQYHHGQQVAWFVVRLIECGNEAHEHAVVVAENDALHSILGVVGKTMFNTWAYFPPTRNRPELRTSPDHFYTDPAMWLTDKHVLAQLEAL